MTFRPFHRASGAAPRLELGLFYSLKRVMRVRSLLGVFGETGEGATFNMCLHATAERAVSCFLGVLS